MAKKVVRASDTFIRLQGLVETFAAACSGSLLLGDGGGVEARVPRQPAERVPVGLREVVAGPVAIAAGVGHAGDAASVSVSNLLMATTTLTPYWRAFSMCFLRLTQPARRTSRFSVR